MIPFKTLALQFLDSFQPLLGVPLARNHGASLSHLQESLLSTPPSLSQARPFQLPHPRTAVGTQIFYHQSPNFLWANSQVMSVYTTPAPCPLLLSLTLLKTNKQKSLVKNLIKKNLVKSRFCLFASAPVWLNGPGLPSSQAD